MGPGLMAFVRTPSGANWTARLWVSANTAPFDAV